MIDRSIFNHQIAILAEMHRYDLSAPTIDEYYRLLSAHLSTAQFLAACDALAVDRSGFWPKPGAFLAAAGVAPNTRAALETEGGKLFAAVKRWLDGCGGQRFIQAADYQALAPATRAAVAAVGGLGAIHDVTPERLPKLERDFAAHYAEAVAGARENAIAPTARERALPGEHHAPLPPLLKAS